MERKRRPLILITNDDGIKAGGLIALVEMAKPFGDLVIVVPNESYSGMSHAITVKNPLYVKEVKRKSGVILYKVNGTPVDCVKIALNNLLERKPDFILSGINHGSNSSASVHYSGTMGAAREGAINDIPSIGFSLLNYSHSADFTPSLPYLRQVFTFVQKNGLPNGTFLNVNIPDGAGIKGIKICRQAKGRWVEEFVEREDPRHRKYFWLTGRFQNDEPEASDTDEYVLQQNFVSIVPCQIDSTNNSYLNQLKTHQDELQVQ